MSGVAAMQHLSVGMVMSTDCYLYKKHRANNMNAKDRMAAANAKRGRKRKFSDAQSERASESNTNRYSKKRKLDDSDASDKENDPYHGNGARKTKIATLSRSVQEANKKVQLLQATIEHMKSAATRRRERESTKRQDIIDEYTSQLSIHGAADLLNEKLSDLDDPKMSSFDIAALKRLQKCLHRKTSDHRRAVMESSTKREDTIRSYIDSDIVDIEKFIDYKMSRYELSHKYLLSL